MDSASIALHPREQGAGQGVGVENGAGSACVNDPEMHQRFRAGSAFPINDLSVLIDFDQLSGCH
jgi:hypothetical protein